MCGLFSVLGYFGTWIRWYSARHDGSDFWVGVLLALLAGIQSRGPRQSGQGRVRGYKGTEIPRYRGTQVRDKRVVSCKRDVQVVRGMEIGACRVLCCEVIAGSGNSLSLICWSRLCHDAEAIALGGWLLFC